MENAKQQQVRQWVMRQAAVLDPPPGWQPDSAAALARMHARMGAVPARPAWWRGLGWAMAALVIPAIVLVLPEARLLAQQLWQYLTVRHLALLRLNLWPKGGPSP